MNTVDKAACAARTVFVTNGWTWGLQPLANEHIPTAVEIAHELKRLLTDVQGKDVTQSECGRLMVQRDTDLGCYNLYLNLGHLLIKAPHEEDIMTRGGDG